jgi:hypothetical protein
VAADFGRVSYRHSRLPNGGWLVEEQHAGADPRRHVDRQTVRLSLAPDLTVRSGDFEVESFVGTEKLALTKSEDGGYTARYQAVDGFESESVLTGGPRVPSERLLLSVVPRLIVERGAGALPALEVEADHLSPAELTLSPGSQDNEWQVRATRPGQQAEQTYRLAPGGRLERMDEMMPLLWPRELVPADQDAQHG